MTQKNDNRSNFNWITTINTWFIDPVVTVNDDDYSKIRILSLFWFGLVTVIVLGSLPYFYVNPDNTINTSTTIIGSILVTGCYVLSRLGYYTTAAWGMVAVISLATFALGVSPVENSSLLLIYLLIPILMCGVLFSTVTMLLVSGIFIFTIALLPMMFEHIILQDLLIGPISVLVSLTFVLFIGIQFSAWGTKRQNSRNSTATPTRLRHMMDASLDSIILNRDGKVCYVNQSGVNLLGAESSSSVLNHHLQDFVQHDARPDLPARIRRLKDSGQYIITTREKVRRLDSNVLDVEVITDQIMFEEQLTTQLLVRPQKKTTTIKDDISWQFLKFTDDLVLSHRFDGEITYANEMSVQVTGYMPDELIGKQIADVIPAYYESALQPHITDTGSFSPHIFHAVTRSNGRRPIRINTCALYPEQPESDRLVIIRDVTEQEIDKQAVNQANRRFEKIMRSGVVAMALISNEDYRFVDVNDTFCTLISYTRNRLINTRIGDLGLWKNDAFKVLIDSLHYDTPIHAHKTTLYNASDEDLNVQVFMELIELGNEPCTLLMVPNTSQTLETNRLIAERESRYRIVSELMSDYAYGWTLQDDNRLKCEWITGAFERITGYSVDKARQWISWNLVYTDDTDIYHAMLQNLKQGNPQTLDYRILTRTGDIRWVRDFAHPIFDNGTVVGIYGAVQDTTDQHIFEENLRLHTLEQAIVAEIGQKALLEGMELDVLLDEALPLITQVLNVQYCNVYALDEDKQQLILRGAVGWSGVTETIINLSGSEVYTQPGYTLITGEPITVSNMQAERRFIPGKIIEDTNIVSGLTVLIHGRSNILGVLGVYSNSNYEFKLGDINFLQAIANTMAAYMEQQKTARKEREQRLLAEALRDTAEVLNSTLQFDAVLDRMFHHLARVVSYDAASLMLIDGNYATTMQFVGVGDYELQSDVKLHKPVPIKALPLVAYMIDNAEPLMLNDTRKDPRWQVLAPETGWIRSYVGAPILFQGELIGILNVDSATPNKFGMTDAQRLMAFANQASIAIHNARYAQQLQDEVEKQTAQLNIEHRRLESVLKATGEGIFYTDDTIILFVNNRLCEMLGYTAQELVGQHTSMLEGNTWNEQMVRRWRGARQNLLQNRVIHVENQLMRKNGTPVDVALTISMAGMPPQSDDDPITTVTVVRDISQQKMLDKQRENFISNASHELRSPITSINTRLYLMRNKPSEMEKHITLMERVVERLNNLIEDLLDRSRMEQETIQLRNRNVVLQNVVEKITEIMADDAGQSGLTLLTDFIDEPVRVFIDTDRMAQVITNIITNAINYTNAGGTITVEIRRGEMPGDDETSYAKINIIDTGIGISPDHLPHIFDEFFRANKHIRGNGLGLNIARELVRLHGGDITVTSVEGEGSTFTVWLPVNDELLL